MIECEICKKEKNESQFVELRYGGFAICVSCADTLEAKKYRDDRKEILETQYQKDMEYQREEERRMKEQIYDDF